ncbi:hypothetical protein [Hymenobacter sp. BT190]|uniref:hypothetical protein n=1 Tax=Hymenobacter sp. BT190 TaxID=2763505 RepID=UPI0016518DB1|nr:hypothetical protein [Hymenobacter sp. BT190]MBC6697504.1 hypothetical protein [Hymenobacter sp. BT190]
MVSKPEFKPKPEHWALYSQVAFMEPAISVVQGMKRLLGIGLITLAIVLLVPFLPSRRPADHLPSTVEEYGQKLPVSIFLGIVVFCFGVSEWLVKPRYNQRMGYRLVGQFQVRIKMKVLGFTWLELAPDETHRVGVTNELYDAIENGDVVEVTYSASKDFISVRKISQPSPTD